MLAVGTIIYSAHYIDQFLEAKITVKEHTVLEVFPPSADYDEIYYKISCDYWPKYTYIPALWIEQGSVLPSDYRDTDSTEYTSYSTSEKKARENLRSSLIYIFSDDIEVLQQRIDFLLKEESIS